MRNTSGLKRTAGPGRPKGIKEKFPRSAKRHVEWLLETYGLDPMLLDEAMRRGLQSRPGPSALYCRMVIEHLKGAPDQRVDLVDRVVLAPRE